MTTETQKMIERIPLEIINNSKFGLVDELYSTDYVEHTPQPGVAPTREGLKQTAIALKTAFPDLRYTIEDVIDEWRPDRASPDRQRHHEGLTSWACRRRQARNLDRDPHRTGRQRAPDRALGPDRPAGHARPARRHPVTRAGPRRGLVVATTRIEAPAATPGLLAQRDLDRHREDGRGTGGQILAHVVGRWQGARGGRQAAAQIRPRPWPSCTTRRLGHGAPPRACAKHVSRTLPRCCRMAGCSWPAAWGSADPAGWTGRWDPPSCTIRPAEPGAQPRAWSPSERTHGHVLPDGKVLVAGGRVADGRRYAGIRRAVRPGQRKLKIIRPI